MAKKPIEDQFSPEETRLRVEAAIRGARLVGHKSQDEMKLGKAKGKRPGPSKKVPRKR